MNNDKYKNSQHGFTKRILISIIFVAFSVGIILGLSMNAFAQQSNSIPNWIKNTAKWWADGQVSDSEFIKALQWLIDQKILVVSQSSTSQQNTQTQSQNHNNITNSNSGSDTIITNSDFPKVNANIDAYKDAQSRFSGKIVGIDTKNGVTALTLNLSPTDYGRDIFVVLNSENQNSYVKDDCIMTEGKIYGKEEGQNVFGALLSYPRVNGEKINKLSCLDAQYPALKTVTVNISQTIGNMTIKINKVEFTEKHTRVFLTIQNLNTERKINFSQYDSSIVQGQSQYSYASSLGIGIQEIDTSILPGTTESGYIIYEPVPQNSFRLILKADEELLDSDFNNPSFSIYQLVHKFTFEIPVEQ